MIDFAPRVPGFKQFRVAPPPRHGGAQIALPAPRPATSPIEQVRGYGVLATVQRRGRRSVNFRLLAEQWDRIGQFYAANRVVGRALKTEILLRHKSEP